MTQSSFARHASPTAPRPAAIKVDANERLRRRVLRVLAAMIALLMLFAYPVGGAGQYTHVAVAAWTLIAVPAFLVAILAAAATRDRIAGPINPRWLGVTISLLALMASAGVSVAAVSGFVEQVCGPDLDLRLVVEILGVFVLMSVASVSVAVHVTRDARAVAAAWVTPLGLTVAGIVATWATTADCS